MQCPIDGAELASAERSGVEIDYCPKCRGVWLDRGELDKIIERSAAEVAPSGPRDGGGARPDAQGGTPRKKRGSFLGELFDF